MENLQLSIDSYPSRKAMGFYKLSDSTKKYARESIQTGAEAASFYASTGDKLTNFENYKISDLAAEVMYDGQKEIVIGYKPGPTIDFKA